MIFILVELYFLSCMIVASFWRSKCVYMFF